MFTVSAIYIVKDVEHFSVFYNRKTTSDTETDIPYVKIWTKMVEFVKLKAMCHSRN
jgi:hypothetical protein